MKQRILSGALVFGALVVMLVFYQTAVVNVIAALLSGIAVFELLFVTGVIKNKLMLSGCILLALYIPFAEFFLPRMLGAAFLLFLVLCVFCILRYHETVPMVNILAAGTISVFVPATFAIMSWLRQFSDHALIEMILIFASAWLCDTGAYFTGVFFGKHKMTPKISPKKTVEGAVGGVLTVAILFPLILFIYQKIMGDQVTISYLYAVAVGIVCALVSMAGDLCASVLKRQHGIKDYGKLLPGHGGVMDRFDSYLFTAPAFLLMDLLLPLIR